MPPEGRAFFLLQAMLYRMANAKRDRQKAARALTRAFGAPPAPKASYAELPESVKLSHGGDVSGLLGAVLLAERTYELARARRDRALLAALSEHSLAQVGEVLGMTRQAVADRQRRATGVVRAGRL